MRRLVAPAARAWVIGRIAVVRVEHESYRRTAVVSCCESLDLRMLVGHHHHRVADLEFSVNGAAILVFHAQFLCSAKGFGVEGNRLNALVNIR